MFIKPAIAAIAAVSFLGACTVEKTYVTPTTEPTDYTYDTTPAYDSDDLFIETITDEYPYAEQMYTRKLLIETAKSICDSIDSGATFADIISIAVDNGLDPEFIGYVTGAGIVFYCPSNQWFIDQYAS